MSLNCYSSIFTLFITCYVDRILSLSLWRHFLYKVDDEWHKNRQINDTKYIHLKVHFVCFSIIIGFKKSFHGIEYYLS